MITQPIKEKFTRWSLERVRFLLAHLEDFIDDDLKTVKERSRGFVAESGLENIENLLVAEPGDPNLPLMLLERLSAFFAAGVLLQRGPAEENANWWATDLFWRGSVFHLELKDQVQANRLVPEIPPLQVQRAPAGKTLAELKLEFLVQGLEADAYLVRPTPNLAYVLVSALPAPWLLNHVTEAHRLINKCFIY